MLKYVSSRAEYLSWISLLGTISNHNIVYLGRFYKSLIYHINSVLPPPSQNVLGTSLHPHYYNCHHHTAVTHENFLPVRTWTLSMMYIVLTLNSLNDFRRLVPCFYFKNKDNWCNLINWYINDNVNCSPVNYPQ